MGKVQEIKTYLFLYLFSDVSTVQQLQVLTFVSFV